MNKSRVRSLESGTFYLGMWRPGFKGECHTVETVCIHRHNMQQSSLWHGVTQFKVFFQLKILSRNSNRKSLKEGLYTHSATKTQKMYVYTYIFKEMEMVHNAVDWTWHVNQINLNRNPSGFLFFLFFRGFRLIRFMRHSLATSASSLSVFILSFILARYGRHKWSMSNSSRSPESRWIINTDSWKKAGKEKVADALNSSTTSRIKKNGKTQNCPDRFFRHQCHSRKE